MYCVELLLVCFSRIISQGCPHIVDMKGTAELLAQSHPGVCHRFPILMISTMITDAVSDRSLALYVSSEYLRVSVSPSLSSFVAHRN